MTPMTGLLTPALHQLTAEERAGWYRYLALCQEAVNQGESHFLMEYLKLAEKDGFSPRSLYSKTAGSKPTWPTLYDDFKEKFEDSMADARSEDPPAPTTPPSSDSPPPSRPQPPSPPPPSETT